jgi:malate synthase
MQPEGNYQSITGVYIAPDPSGSGDNAMATVLSKAAQQFLVALRDRFQEDIEDMHLVRQQRQLELDMCKSLEDAHATFRFRNDAVEDKKWVIDPLPHILDDRRVDIGDVSPARTEEFVRALNSEAQGVQADLDDGHCPSWKNMLRAHVNLRRAVEGRLPRMKTLDETALLILRPRAWNMDEHVIEIEFCIMSRHICIYYILSRSIFLSMVELFLVLCSILACTCFTGREEIKYRTQS